MSVGWLDSLPNLLAAADFRAVAGAMRAARAADRGIVWGFGAHVIKAGLGPVLVDLMARGYVSAIALNGAGIIHDTEVALAGRTSEDVDATLGQGTFGMSEETGRGLNEAIAGGVARGLGLGQSVVEWLGRQAPPHADVSVLAAAWIADPHALRPDTPMPRVHLETPRDAHDIAASLSSLGTPATAAPAASEALPALRASAPQGTPAAEAVQAINQSLISSDPQENLRVLNQLLDGYIMSRNTVPADLEDLVKAKMLSRIPPAPAGKKFAIDRKTNRVVLADQ